MCCQLLESQEQVNELLRSAFLNREVKTQLPFLTVSHLNKLLKTFPPVWKCKLAGFRARSREDMVQLYMLVEHKHGDLSYYLGEVYVSYETDFSTHISVLNLKESK